MKKLPVVRPISFMVVMFLIGLSLQSCTKDVAENVHSAIDSKDVELIRSLGFSTEGLIKRDDYYCCSRRNRNYA